MNITAPHIRITRQNILGRNLNVTILKGEGDIGIFTVKELEYKKQEEYEMLLPCMNLGAEHAQILMDDLWDCGLRPSEGSGSAGSMLATQQHLADMKKILFHKLGIKT